MSNWKHKKKKWQVRHCRKIHKQRAKTYKYNVRDIASTSIHDNYEDSNELKAQERVVTKVAPENFSLIDNPEETMQFFDDILQDMKHRQYGKKYFIDSSHVKHVTVDALIYLIALMQNVHVKTEMNYIFRGNFPEDEKVYRIYQESGFMDYVKANVRRLPKNTEKIQIVEGTKNDPSVAKSFCEFVMKKLGRTRIDMKDLQIIFIELMSNVVHHAYKDNDDMSKQWYIYAEHIDNFVRFVFVDTGVGIASTVKKHFMEKVNRLFGTKALDGDLLKSTFQGDFRTQTNKKYRGNGLVAVKNHARNGHFNRFQVISGKGYCEIDTDKQEDDCLKIKNFKNLIHGTVYTFDVY